MKKEYTTEETTKFKMERNAKSYAEKQARKNPEMVHLSTTTNKLGFRTIGKTFIGSIREKFTGPRRNNFGSIN